MDETERLASILGIPVIRSLEEGEELARRVARETLRDLAQVERDDPIFVAEHRAEFDAYRSNLERLAK